MIQSRIKNALQKKSIAFLVLYGFFVMIFQPVRSQNNAKKSGDSTIL